MASLKVLTDSCIGGRNFMHYYFMGTDKYWYKEIVTSLDLLAVFL